MSLKLKICSDLHIEFGPFDFPGFDLPETEDEKDQVLILAGDVGLAVKEYTYLPYLRKWSERFREIIYILGNHEMYGSSLLIALSKIKNRIDQASLENVHVVENEVIHIDDVSFVCATLWTSYNNGNSMTMHDSQTWMNDHKKIRTGLSVTDAYQRPALPQDMFKLHVKTANWMFPTIKQEKNTGRKVCVVNHHLPSLQSIHETFKNGPYAKLNGAYASDLDDDIIETNPDLIIHGHTHFSWDYMIGETRVICNPRGYWPDSLNPNFNPMLTVEL